MARGRFMYVLGGSYGAGYLEDMCVLDTDPPPCTRVSTPELRLQALEGFVNSEQFADVEFVVEGRRIFAHRVVLTAMSERFRALFSDRFREAHEREVHISGTSHAAFVMLMEYLYCGRFPEEGGGQAAVELLRLADEYMLDHLREMCEKRLEPLISAGNAEDMLSVAERHNAVQLQAVAGTSCATPRAEAWAPRSRDARTGRGNVA
eukprot:CAMPEP_0198429656 /NCGR_PEP_ID=MMETSP1452-20131203/8888_1 /TAXON_ID=1181717 /ORGANISM="Synchroma pusillum, Strain CCMP3072" /LENGTH=205 /DNA_ID=CAMNT_0044150075 /DNA_START=58 /DNA_END=672 /DNA_ORIENTATION=+